MDKIFKFTTPFEVCVEVKDGEENVYLDGFISTTDKDLVNDIVTKNCLESMKEQILSRNIKLDVEHEAFRGSNVEEKEINKTKIPVGRMLDATVESANQGFGLRVKSILNNFNKRFSEIKGSVVNKFLDAYSIAFIPTRVIYKDINGERIRLLDDVSLLNVALTGNPINTMALNRGVFVKAINSLEEYKEIKNVDPKIEDDLVVKSVEVKESVHECMTEKMKKGLSEKEARKECSSKKEEKNVEENNELTEKFNNSENQEVNENKKSVDEAVKMNEKSNELIEVITPKIENEEVKSLREEVKFLTEQIKVLGEQLSKPIHKSIAEQRPTEQVSNTSFDPLDLIN